MKRKIGNSWGVGGGYTWPLWNRNSKGVGGPIRRTICGWGMDIFWNHTMNFCALIRRQKIPMVQTICGPAATQARWLQKSWFFHRNDTLGTLTFTGSENWASFSFPRGQPCVLVVVFFSNLLYFKLIWTLSYSKLVENKKN